MLLTEAHTTGGTTGLPADSGWTVTPSAYTTGVPDLVKDYGGS